MPEFVITFIGDNSEQKVVKALSHMVDNTWVTFYEKGDLIRSAGWSRENKYEKVPTHRFLSKNIISIEMLSKQGD